MTSEPTGGSEDAEAAAVPAVPGDVPEPSAGPPVYADVTRHGDRKPVRPPWLQSRAQFGHHAKRLAGHSWHATRYHGLRSPVYAVLAMFWAVVGVFRLTGRWLAWWLLPVPLEAHRTAIEEGWRAWKSVHVEHKKTTKTRSHISLAVLLGAILVFCLLWFFAPRWVWPPIAAGAFLLLARHGHPSGKRIVGPAHVPAAYEALTETVITRALGSLGLAGIDRVLRDGKEIIFPSPVRQDGPGWRAEVDLPHGVTAAQVIDRREQLASGLRRPLGAVWPEPVTHEHAGRLELWVGQEDISKAKPARWPLLAKGTADVFGPLPFGVDPRGRAVPLELIYNNVLTGSIPRQGKTAAVRVLACGCALDPTAELWIHELKGSGDLDPLERVSHRYVSGVDDESVGYAAESLKLLRAEIGKRTERLKAIPRELCPDKRTTREIANRRHLGLYPLVCIIDEAQNLFADPKLGSQAGDDATFVIKIGPAFGVILVLATQRPDRASLPTGISGNVSLRFCLKVMGQTENDMILGTSMYKNGVRSTTFRPKVDAGLGYLVGEGATPQIVRTYYLDMAATERVAVRARALREKAGTLSGVALGEGTGTPDRDVLGDVLEALGADNGLHWGTLAARLSTRYPERWKDATQAAVSAQLRDCGVPSVDVRWPPGRLGSSRKGCRRADVEAAAARDTAGQGTAGVAVSRR